MGPLKVKGEASTAVGEPAKVQAEELGACPTCGTMLGIVDADALNVLQRKAGLEK